VKRPAFTETRCVLLGSDGERGVGGKHAPKKQFLSSSYLFLFSEKRLVLLSGGYFLSMSLFFMGPEETTDESWPDKETTLEQNWGSV